MAYCGKTDEKGVVHPSCTLIHSSAMMGAVSAHALAEARKQQVKPPVSAPPPEVKL